MDYKSLVGVELLAAASRNGKGVRIAVLDSGTPPSCVNGTKWSASTPSVRDTLGHATAIASILVGGAHVGGICRDADLLYIPVLDSSGSGSIDSISDGINVAVENDVDIINMSLGFARTDNCPKRLENACKEAFDAGKVIICAAGNDGGRVNWPAALETTISVGSSDQRFLRAPFSSVGEVDFVAPGVDLEVMTTSGCVDRVSGTSYSAAIVSGIAALLIAEMHLREHSAGMRAVMNALRGIARDVYRPGWDELTGFGVLGCKKQDPYVCMDIKSGFFGRILNKLKNLIFFNNKENRNGSVV